MVTKKFSLLKELSGLVWGGSSNGDLDWFRVICLIEGKSA